MVSVQQTLAQIGLEHGEEKGITKVPPARPIIKEDRKKEVRLANLAKARAARAEKLAKRKFQETQPAMPIQEAPDNPVVEHIPKHYKVEMAVETAKERTDETQGEVVKQQEEVWESQYKVNQAHEETIADMTKRVKQLESKLNGMEKKLIPAGTGPPTKAPAAPVARALQTSRFIW